MPATMGPVASHGNQEDGSKEQVGGDRDDRAHAEDNKVIVRTPTGDRTRSSVAEGNLNRNARMTKVGFKAVAGGFNQGHKKRGAGQHLGPMMHTSGGFGGGLAMNSSSNMQLDRLVVQPLKQVIAGEINDLRCILDDTLSDLCDMQQEVLDLVQEAGNERANASSKERESMRIAMAEKVKNLHKNTQEKINDRKSRRVLEQQGSHSGRCGSGKASDEDSPSFRSLQKEDSAGEESPA